LPNTNKKANRPPLDWSSARGSGEPLRRDAGALRQSAFDREFDAAFASVLERYGLPELTEVKSAVIEAVTTGKGPGMVTLPSDRTARAAIRVTLRQLAAAELDAPVLAAWLIAYDRRDPAEAEDPMEALH
jgi:hypothetical protein